MKELSRNKKIKVLKLAIKYLEKKETYHMCVAIRLAYNVITHNCIEDYKYSLIWVPELLNYKPDDACEAGAWFGHHEYNKRIEILNSILSNLEEKEKAPLIKRIWESIIKQLNLI